MWTPELLAWRDAYETEEKRIGIYYKEPKMANVNEMIETARIIAERFHGELTVAYVNQPQISAADQRALDEKLAVARAAGARIEILDGENPVDALLDYARSRGVTQIFIGQSGKLSWRDRIYRSLVDRLIQSVEGIDIQVFPR